MLAFAGWNPAAAASPYVGYLPAVPCPQSELLLSSFATAESMSDAVMAWYVSSILLTVAIVHPSMAAISKGVAPASARSVQDVPRRS